MTNEQDDGMLQEFLDENPEVKAMLLSLKSEKLRELYAAEVMRLYEIWVANKNGYAPIEEAHDAVEDSLTDAFHL